MNQGLDIPVIFNVGPVEVTRTVVTTWGLMAGLGIAAWLIRRRLKPTPGPFQMAVEAMMTYLDEQIREIVGREPARYLPLAASLFIFILTANLISLLPVVESPTADPATTSALALIVFFVVPFYGITERGFGGYLRGYLKPAWIMLPFNLIGELSRTLALSVRLFGNMMSGQLVVGVLISLAGVVAVVVEFLGLITGVVQAYIFTIITLVYIGGAVRSGAPAKEGEK